MVMRRAPFEVTLLIENHPCEAMKVISLTGMKAYIEGVKLGERATDHVVSFESEVTADEVRKLRENAVKVLKLSNNRVWVRTNRCSVCKTLYSSDVVVEKIKMVKEGAVLYTLLVPGASSLRELLSNLTQGEVKVTVLSVYEMSDAVLTERQIEVLKLAYKLGYFDNDRKITLTQLAEELGISASTLEEILRKALRKTVKYYLDKH